MIRRITFILVNTVLKIDKEAKIMKNTMTAALHTSALSLILYLPACAVKPAIDTEYARSSPSDVESVKKTNLFNNDAPVFYYNPHWDMKLSSYLKWEKTMNSFFTQIKLVWFHQFLLLFLSQILMYLFY